MSGDTTSVFADMAADNHFESNDKPTLLRNGGRDVETHSENDDRRMSQLAQSTELRNGEITPYAAGPTKFNSELQNQLTQLLVGREPRRWITETEWTVSIQEDRLRDRPPSVVSIFRVPKLLKDIKKEAYVPQRVSLGPYHHGSRDLPPMNHDKGRALRRMMTRLNTNSNLVIESNNMDFAKRAMEEILKVEKKIRDSYEENIDCDGETLARMLTLDGCFLLEVLRTLAEYRSTRETAENCYDPIFGENKLLCAANDVQNDILKLENQMPLIILRKLLELELHSAVEVEKHLNVLMGVISAIFNPFDNKNIDKAEYWSWLQQAEQEVHHVLGFLHTVIASPQSPRQGNSGISIDCCSQCIRMLRDKSKAGGARVGQGECSFSTDCCGKQCIMKIYDNNKAGNDYMARRIPRAVELRNAGITFQKSDGGINDIKFDENSATIFLPPISITDPTESVFRNLIAYEMSKPSERNYVSSYVALMDGMIDSEEDVALMRRMGVLSNWLGSDKEVADLFNGLAKEVVLTGNDLFKELKQNVSAHYRNKFKVQFAELVREHFSSPWKALALVGAIVVLVLTALQTIYTMK